MHSECIAGSGMGGVGEEKRKVPFKHHEITGKAYIYWRYASLLVIYMVVSVIYSSVL